MDGGGFCETLMNNIPCNTSEMFHGEILTEIEYIVIIKHEQARVCCANLQKALCLHGLHCGRCSAYSISQILFYDPIVTFESNLQSYEYDQLLQHGSGDIEERSVQGLRVGISCATHPIHNAGQSQTCR